MTSLRSTIKWLLAVVGLLFALVILKIALVLTAKPKITVDYVTEYNRITRPANYDPNDNAAPYYQKAFDAFVEMPVELKVLRVNWPADLNSTEQALLENWLASNSQALEFFKIAANKPYNWLERHARADNDMMTMMHLESQRQLTIALTWNAKLEAYKGRLQTAFKDIIDCYRAGRQKYHTPSFTFEQKVGLDNKQDAVFGAMIILDQAQIDNATLKFFQDTLLAELNKDAYVSDIQVEKLVLYDALQRNFVENGKGTGRLYWKKAKIFPGSTLSFGWYKRWYEVWYEWDGPWYNACPFLYGPTKKETIAQIEQLFKLFEPLKTQTPWQLRNQGYSFAKTEEICNNNFFLRMFGLDPRYQLYQYYNVKSRTEAVIAVAAILRFKADNGRLPATLDELVSVGDLRSVPMDPYSNGPLVYKPAGDNFKLYSVGTDFTDDDGAITVETTEGTRWDILFWPVKKPKVSYHQPSAEELEKLRAAKEADVLGTAQDQNSSTPNK